MIEIVANEAKSAFLDAHRYGTTAYARRYADYRLGHSD